MKIGNLNIYGIVYKITNKINHKVYIGITKQKRGFKDRYNRSGNGIERVYNYHKKRKEKNEYYNKQLFYDIEHYGFDAFEVIEIFDIAFTMEELKIKEKSWIAIYDSFCNGYNGDEGGLYDGDTIGIIREVICLNDMKIYNNAKAVLDFYEVNYSSLIDKLKSDISNIATINGYSFMYYEHYNKLNHNDKMRYSYIDINTNDFRVVCLNNGKIYESPKYLEDNFGYFSSCISACCRNENKSAYKDDDGEPLVWRYYKDYINMTEEEIEEILDDAIIIKKVICLNTLEVFKSSRYGAKKYNICKKSIAECCRGLNSKNANCYSAGKLNDIPLVWVYYKDYINMTEEEVQDRIKLSQQNHHKTTSVVCLNTREIFDRTKEANDKYNCHGDINKVCNNGNRKTCGRLEDGTPLTWVYYKDYINMTEEEIENRITLSQQNDSENGTMVRCIDTNEIFISITECSRKLNIDRKSIRECCNKKRKTAKGYRFEFYKDDEEVA